MSATRHPTAARRPIVAVMGLVLITARGGAATQAAPDAIAENPRQLAE